MTDYRDSTLHAPRDSQNAIKRLSFYATPEHPCSYLDDRMAITLFADPYAQLNTTLYSQLSAYGFRRSGKHIYRPACPQCKACVAVRIPVNAFRPRRSQRRIWTRNQDLQIDQCTPQYRNEQHDLYLKYIRARHPDGSMDEPDPERYMAFLTCDWSDTRFVEFRLRDKLLCVAVIDQLQQGLSAVYTYFDPEHAQRGLGTFAILWQIERCRQLGLAHLYLGYWIEQSPKMRYKSDFQPLEHYLDGQWQRPHIPHMR